MKHGCHSDGSVTASPIWYSAYGNAGSFVSEIIALCDHGCTIISASSKGPCGAAETARQMLDLVVHSPSVACLHMKEKKPLYVGGVAPSDSAWPPQLK